MDCIISKSTKKGRYMDKTIQEILVANKTLGENHLSLMYTMDSGFAITLMN